MRDLLPIRNTETPISAANVNAAAMYERSEVDAVVGMLLVCRGCATWPEVTCSPVVEVVTFSACGCWVGTSESAMFMLNAFLKVVTRPGSSKKYRFSCSFHSPTDVGAVALLDTVAVTFGNRPI